MTTLLNQPIRLPNGQTFKNRFFKGAMSEQLAEDHRPSEGLISLYRRWAEGGAGVLVTGNVMVDRRALGGPKDVVVEDERDLPMLRRWAEAGKAQGTTLLMQINHPGKQSPKDLSPEPVAPSAVALGGSLAKFFNPPRALSETEIEELIERFANTARIAEKAGFSGVQIHAAHGYLISQFLSPLHNQRQDQWGGDLDNRMRFLLEIYRQIRARTSRDFIVGVKLNSSDFQRGGFSEAESIQVVEKLVEAGVDSIEISGGNYESPAMLEGVKSSTKAREAYFLDYAAQVRKVCPIPLTVTGGFRSEQAMNAAIESGQVDLIGLAKPFAIMPDLPNRILQGNYQTLQLKPIRTGLKKIDSVIGSTLEMGWYFYQMERLSQGKAANLNYSPWRLLFRILWQQGRKGFRKERG